MSAHVEVYRRRLAPRNQRHRWRLVAANGNKLANGGEGYSDQGRAADMARTVLGGEYANVTIHYLHPERGETGQVRSDALVLALLIIIALICFLVAVKVGAVG